MAGQVLALFADNLAQPLFDLRVVDVIVINPALVAGVVGRIDIDALDTPLIPGQQRFQGFQIIAPNDHVFAAVVFVVLSVFIKAVLALQHPKRHVLMVIDHLAFSNPFKCWHGYPPYCRQELHLWFQREKELFLALCEARQVNHFSVSIRLRYSIRQ